MPVHAKQAFFIKLGPGGRWEDECLQNGTLHLGYSETPHELCVDQKWGEVRDFWFKQRGNQRSATSDMNQIKTFYESNEDVLFITFANRLLYWCQPSGPVKVMEDRTRNRGTKDGWHSTNIEGMPLTTDKLSGQLLQVQRFQGTICNVWLFDYLLRKINNEKSPEADAAEKAEKELIQANVNLIRRLTWKDFELLVELIFSKSGYQRISSTGGTQKTVDLELTLPISGERAFVQIKSKADTASFEQYKKRFESADMFDRMFFVWHTGTVPAKESEDGITLIGPEDLSQHALDAGLTSWLREKGL